MRNIIKQALEALLPAVIAMVASAKTTDIRSQVLIFVPSFLVSFVLIGPWIQQEENRRPNQSIEFMLTTLADLWK
jgi:hypothetical protein